MSLFHTNISIKSFAVPPMNRSTKFPILYLPFPENKNHPVTIPLRLLLLPPAQPIQSQKRTVPQLPPQNKNNGFIETKIGTYRVFRFVYNFLRRRRPRHLHWSLVLRVLREQRKPIYSIPLYFCGAVLYRPIVCPRLAPKRIISGSLWIWSLGYFFLFFYFDSL